MTIDQGMNVAEVKQLGEALKSVSGKLDAIVQLLNSKVGSTTWVGPDATKFKNDWWPGHRGRLQQLRTDLDGFGQSALNNASDQEHASDGGNTGGGTPVVGIPPGGEVHVPGGTAPAVTPGGRDWHDVQNGYDKWAASHPGGQTRFGPGGESQYQCTGWANYRWHELGYNGPPIGGNGGAMAGNAPGDTSTTPSLHAMASYGAGTSTSPGHVMIVEEVSGDGKTIRVSEMNTDSNWNVANPNEYRDTRTFTMGADGKFHSSRGDVINFAAFPG